MTVSFVSYDSEIWFLMWREEGVTKQTEVFGLLWGERTYSWRKLRKFCSSPDITRIMKSRRVRWTGFVAHEMRYFFMTLLISKSK
jgi:hypothetical protein